MTAPPPAPPENPRPSRWRRLRRLLGAGLLVVLLVVALAPSVATSRLVLSRVESAARERTGRAVRIEGLQFGWFTPLRLGVLEVGALPTERDRPLLRLEKLSLPLTLAGCLHRPPFRPGTLHAASLEANVVRPHGGTWNVMELAGRFPPSSETPPAPAPAPSPLALDGLHLAIDRVAVVVVDEAGDTPVSASLADASLKLEWPGYGKPLSLALETELRLNGAARRGTLHAVVSDWTEPGGLLQSDHAGVRLWTGERGGETETESAGIWLDAGVAHASTLRAVLDTAWLTSWLREGFPTARVPAMSGMVDLRLHGMSAGASSWRIESLLRTRQLDVLPGPVLPDAELSSTLVLDAAGKRLEQLAARFDSSITTGTISIGKMGLGPDPSWQEVSGAGEWQLGPLTRLAAALAGGTEGQTPLDGRLAWSFALEARPAGDPIHGTAQLSWSGGTLSTLRPFVPEPAWLGAGPWNLAGTRGDLGLAFTTDLRERRLSLSDVRATGPLGSFSGRLACDLARPAEQWSATWNLDANLEELGALLAGRFLPPDLAGLAGSATTTGRAGADGATITSSGGFDLAGLQAAWQGRELPRGSGDTNARWNVTVDVPSRSVELSELTLRGAGLETRLSGSASPRSVDLDSSSTLVPAELLRVASLAGPAPDMELQGALAARLRVTGPLDGTLQVGSSLEAPADFSLRMPGRAVVAGPLVLSFDGKVAPAARRLSIDSLSFVLNSAARGDLHGHANLGDAGEVDLVTSTTLAYGPLLAMIDPAMMAATGELHVDGATEVQLRLSGRLDATPAGISYPGPWTLSGRAHTRVPSLAFAKGTMQMELGGLDDAREFSLSLPPLDPLGAVYRDTARTTMDAMEGPMGVSLRKASVDARLEAGARTPVLFEATAAGFDHLGWTTDTMSLSIPATRFSCNTRTVAAASRFDMPSLQFDMPGITSGTLGLSSNWATRDWATSGTVGLADIGALLSMYSSPATEGAARPAIRGGSSCRFDLRGRLTEGGFDPRRPLPALGDVSWEAHDLGLGPAEKPLVSDAGARANLSLSNDLVTCSGSLGAKSVALPASTSLRSLEGISASGSVRVTKLNTLVATGGMRIESLSLDAGGRVSADNLRPALVQPPAGIRGWLDTVPLEASLNAGMDLGTLDRMTRDFVSAGDFSAALAARNNPGRALELRWDVGGEQLRLGVEGLALVDGASGTWSGRKTWYAQPGRVPPAVQEGRFYIENIEFRRDPVGGTISGTELRIRGLDGGLVAETVTQNMLGGPARSAWRIESQRGDPVLSGEVESTGFDGRTLIPQFRYVPATEVEINSLSRFRWRLRDNLTAATMLDDLVFSIDATRIGRRALGELLNALDPTGKDPAFQNTKTALQFGNPVGGRFALAGGLVSMNTTLRVSGGANVPLPILERAPVGQLLDVYRIKTDPAVLASTRRLLLLLLGTDEIQLEKLMQSPRKTGSP